MKKLVILILMASAISNLAHARYMDVFQTENLKPSSRITAKQAQDISKIIKAWIEEEEKKVEIEKAILNPEKTKDLIKKINQKLTEYGAPTVEEKPNPPKIETSNFIGFASNQITGLKISDGRHEFCFPCWKGYNNFDWGVVPQKAVTKKTVPPSISPYTNVKQAEKESSR